MFIIIIMFHPLAEGWMQWSFILFGVVPACLTAWWYCSPVHVVMFVVHFVLGLLRLSMLHLQKDITSLKACYDLDLYIG